MAYALYTFLSGHHPLSTLPSFPGGIPYHPVGGGRDVFGITKTEISTRYL